jgi:predicted RecA/RadA family phage recombinase
MTTKFVQRGDVVTYSNAGSAITAGSVVTLKHCVGVALTDIAATTGTGSVALEGVFTVPKTTGTAWLNGEKLLWDVSASKFDGSGATPATGDILGAAIAFGAAASGDATATVKLVQGNTTLT